jgi:peptidoglycan/xylan/chitin deacetylase (PgdA/CDA1 family)
MKRHVSPQWPEGRRSALLVTVNFFDDAFILAQEPRMAGRDKSLSVWRYGAMRGVERLLKVFAEQQVRATWFVPGIVAVRHAGLVREIQAAGHEIGNATQACENFNQLALAEQVASVRQAQEAIAEVTGEAPTAFRSPWGNWAPGLAPVLADAGIRWTSSWRGDDRPYDHPLPEGLRLIEIPLHYELEDEPYFVFNLYPPVPAGQPRIAAYGGALDNMRQDMDGFHRLGLCMPLVMHPDILGTAGRIGVVRDLLAHARQTPGLWLATGAEIADWWRSSSSGNEPGHPVDVFAHEAAKELAP